MQEETLDRWVEAAEGQVSTEVEDEVVILDVEAGRYFGVDGVAAWIWDRVQEPVRVGALLEELLDVYDVDRARAADDLEGFLSELETRGLLEVRDARDG